MKSSCKVIRASDAAGVLTWAPAIFEQASEAKGVKIEDVLALFKPRALPAAPDKTEAARAPRLFAAQQWDTPSDQGHSEVSEWSPAELDWVTPFSSLTVWDTAEPLETKHAEQPDAVAPCDQEEIRSLLAQAHEQAGEIILQAQRSAEETLRRAQEQIRQESAAGYQQGWEAALAEASVSLQAAQQIILELKTWRDQMLATSEAVVIDIVRQIAGAMFGQGVALDEKALHDNLNRLLENAKSLGELKIFLNPDDAARLDAGWRDLQAMIIGSKVFIIPSEGIKPGGCFIQGQMGSVDATVDTQLKSLLEVFVSQEEPAEVA